MFVLPYLLRSKEVPGLMVPRKATGLLILEALAYLHGFGALLYISPRCYPSPKPQLLGLQSWLRDPLMSYETVSTWSSMVVSLAFQGNTLSPEPFGSDLHNLLCARAIALEIGVCSLEWATYFLPTLQGREGNSAAVANSYEVLCYGLSRWPFAELS